jgi:hypothetical protein
MLVFGDRTRRVSTRDALEEVRARWLARARRTLGLARHEAIVAALVELGAAAQGVLDARGDDDPLGARVMLAAVALGRAAIASYDAGAAGFVPERGLSLALADATLAVERARDVADEGVIAVRAPEGYAHYATYPELYVDAARAARLGGDALVIGIRSIGTSLAAVVAAAAGARARVHTLRPAGHPFRREVVPSRALASALSGLPPSHARVAIVDEGPGISGSSFGAVADAVEAAGVPARSVELFPSHDGRLGPVASPRHAARWSSARRHVGSFERVFLARGARLSPVLDAGVAEVRDLSGGLWRAHRHAREEEWPPAHRLQERRKYLVVGASGPEHATLAKFAGLARSGERAFDRARALARAGFSPSATALRHGFLLGPWIDRAETLAAAIASGRLAPAASIEQIGRYLGARTAVAPCERDERDGAADARALLAMTRSNAGEALGTERAAPLARFAPALARLEEARRPHAIDGRLHAWEWLVVEGDRLLKTDAVDHACGHDLVGVQDLAWDVAGAQVELGALLAEACGREAAEGALLQAAERAAGRALDPLSLAFHRCAYLAFQLGRAALAVDALAAFPDDERRMRHERERYAAALGDALDGLS